MRWVFTFLLFLIVALSISAQKQDPCAGVNPPAYCATKTPTPRPTGVPPTPTATPSATPTQGPTTQGVASIEIGQIPEGTLDYRSDGVLVWKVTGKPVIVIINSSGLQCVRSFIKKGDS